MGTSIDAAVAQVIKQNQSFDAIADRVQNVNLYNYLGRFSSASFAWYPFGQDDTVLLAGSAFGSFAANIADRVDRLDILEMNGLRTDAVRVRLKGYANVSVVCGDVFGYAKAVNKLYSHIIFFVDEYADEYKSRGEYESILRCLKTLMKDGGRMLIAMPNRFGVKYLCGGRAGGGLPFEGLTDDTPRLYRFSANEIKELLRSIGFKNVKIHYVMPDHHIVQLVFTEEHPPGKSAFERFGAVVTDKLRVMSENGLYRGIVENDAYKFGTNSFIIECSDVSSDTVLCAAVSSQRDEERAFATTVHTDCVTKTPLYSGGTVGLEHLIQNCREMSKRGVPTLVPRLEGNGAVMKKISFPTLSEYIYTLKPEDKDEFIEIIDNMYEYILQSSDEVENGEICLPPCPDGADYGAVLKKAYIEMIPVNCFLTDKGFLYYDQEFSAENMPAKYVLFRGLRDIYAFYPDAEKIAELSEMKARYGITEAMWSVFAEEENRFQRDLQQEDANSNFYRHIGDDVQLIQRVRRSLSVEEKNYTKLFDVSGNIRGKRVVLFGGGKQAEYYMEKYGLNNTPLFIADNSADKWGTQKCGCDIKPPMEINRLVYGTYTIVIAMARYEEVIQQLEEMGIDRSSYCVFNRQIDNLRSECLIEDAKTDGRYNIGYVTGVFDLFHIGHLNLLKRSKERCHYLIAGVLTDELAEHDKHKRPFIPFEERIEIVKQCRYVDRVIPVDFDNTDKLEAFKRLHYGCFFAGSDHTDGVKELRKALRALGSECEIFSYTAGTSSTILQNVLMCECERKKRS